MSHSKPVNMSAYLSLFMRKQEYKICFSFSYLIYSVSDIENGHYGKS